MSGSAEQVAEPISPFFSAEFAVVEIQARTPGWMPPRWLLLVLVCVVLFVQGRAMHFVRGHAISATPDTFDSDPDGYLELAHNLIYRGTFGFNYKGIAAAPTAYRPPLYPLLLPICYVLPGGVLDFGLLHIALGVVTVWATWRLGLEWRLAPLGALAAAALVAIDPILLNQSAQPMTETLATCLAALALLLLTRAVQRGSFRSAAVTGALMGLCVLCRPTFLVWLVWIVVVLPFFVSFAWRKALLWTGTLAASAALVLAPWGIRNWREFGVPIITTTHGGYTLLLANNPEIYEYLRSGEWGSVWNANKFNAKWETEADTHKRSTFYGDLPDEVGNDGLAYQQALQNIRNEPLMFAYSCLVRVGRLWAVLPHQLDKGEGPSRRALRYSVGIWYALELSLAAIGLWILRKQLLDQPWIWGLLLLVSFTAVHALYWTDMRMRAPLSSVIALLAAQAVVVLAQPSRRASAVSTSD